MTNDTFRRLADIILNKDAPESDLYHAALQRAYQAQKQKELEGNQ